MAQIEYIGDGTIQKLKEALAPFAPRKIFLVTGKASYAASGAQHPVADALFGLEVLHYTDFGPLPLQEDIERGVEVYKAFGPDLVIAVGGGHVIDVAKAANFLAAKKPLIAIPTTAGSGSEATRFAVVYKDGLKTSLESPEILPAVAIVDPALAQSVSKEVALASGLDALAQSIESLWSLQATEESKGYAKAALELVWKNIVPAIEDNNAYSIGQMMRGAHSAGKAINISKTTACHALSYGLTKRFGVPHGIAVAVFLPSMLRLNKVSLPDPAVTPEAVTSLLLRFGITNLSQSGVKATDIPSLAAEVNIERLSNNPVALTKTDIVRLYTEVL